MHGPSLLKRRQLIHHDNYIHFFPCLMYVISLEWMLLEGRVNACHGQHPLPVARRVPGIHKPWKVPVTEECKHISHRHATPLPLVTRELYGSVANIHILGNNDSPIGTFSCSFSPPFYKNARVEGLFCCFCFVVLCCGQSFLFIFLFLPQWYGTQPRTQRILPIVNTSGSSNSCSFPKPWRQYQEDRTKAWEW